MGLTGGLATNGTSGGGAAGGLLAANNLSDVSSESTSLTNLGGATQTSTKWAQREQAKLTAMGLGGQSFDIFGVYAGTTGTPTSQAVYGSLAGLVAGDVVTNLWVNVTTLGSGTAPTGIYFGLYSAAGALLASTGNINSNSIFTTTIEPVSAALSSPYTVLTTGGYYLAFLENGAWGTTQMVLTRTSTTAGIQTHGIPGGASPPFVYQGSQATLPSPSATFVASANASGYWMGWS